MRWMRGCGGLTGVQMKCGSVVCVYHCWYLGVVRSVVAMKYRRAEATREQEETIRTKATSTATWVRGPAMYCEVPCSLGATG